MALLGGAGLVQAADSPMNDRVERGRELFLREWTAGDARSHGGDGLGPVFNDSSCVACHNAGGAGGAGPASKNVDIVSAFSNAQNLARESARPSDGFFAKAAEALLGIDRPRDATPQPGPRKPDTTELVKAHAGFRAARSVVLHRFGTEAGYEDWRITMLGMGQFVNTNPINFSDQQKGDAEMARIKTLAQFKGSNFQGQAGEFSLLHSQRNPTALFGAGLIDSIPEAVLVAAAEAQQKADASTAGRVARQKDGKVGRFGWKAQTPSLDKFVRTACAVELGLEVPGHSQGGLPQKPDHKAQGIDMDDAECDALSEYVKALPKPAEISSRDAEVVAGKALFGRVGCASCHSPKLGEVDGIYSDLLVHDLGPELGDTGQYGVFTPNSADPDFDDDAQPATPNGGFATVPGGVAVVLAPATPAAVVKATGPAGRQEWRTPPLWGLRDSGPYLHDGRADTIDQAVAFHGGQATKAGSAYFALSPKEKLQFQAFLKSLVAPIEGVAASR